MMEHEFDITPTIRLLNGVCIAIFLSVPVYVVIAVLLTEGEAGTFPSEALPAALVPVLIVVAALLLLAAPAIGNAIKRPERDMTGGAAGTASQRLERFRTGHIVAFALRETAAILGLVLTLVTSNLDWVLILGAATMVAMLLGWPRAAAARRLVKSDAAPLD